MVRLPARLLPFLIATLVAASGARAEPAPPTARAVAEKLSPPAREERAQHLLELMLQQTQAMEKTSSQARDEKDILKLDCVNTKLNQAKGLTRISEQAVADLKEANARNEDDPSLNAFTKVSIASRKVGQLRQEAEQCIGQLAFYTDDKTHVEVEVPANLPNGDPTWVALPSPIDSRPAPASGF